MSPPQSLIHVYCGNINQDPYIVTVSVLIEIKRGDEICPPEATQNSRPALLTTPRHLSLKEDGQKVKSSREPKPASAAEHLSTLTPDLPQRCVVLGKTLIFVVPALQQNLLSNLKGQLSSRKRRSLTLSPVALTLLLYRTLKESLKHRCPVRTHPR